MTGFAGSFAVCEINHVLWEIRYGHGGATMKVYRMVNGFIIHRESIGIIVHIEEVNVCCSHWKHFFLY